MEEELGDGIEVGTLTAAISSTHFLGEQLNHLQAWYVRFS